ncbi:hypothetical protein BKA62DRAFT_727160, partial [Auriculariales sp. MPI-PUGE-AT-0066]
LLFLAAVATARAVPTHIARQTCTPASELTVTQFRTVDNSASTHTVVFAFSVDSTSTGTCTLSAKSMSDVPNTTGTCTFDSTINKQGQIEGADGTQAGAFTFVTGIDVGQQHGEGALSVQLDGTPDCTGTPLSYSGQISLECAYAPGGASCYQPKDSPSTSLPIINDPPTEPGPGQQSPGPSTPPPQDEPPITSPGQHAPGPVRPQPDQPEGPILNPNPGHQTGDEPTGTDTATATGTGTESEPTGTATESSTETVTETPTESPTGSPTPGKDCKRKRKARRAVRMAKDA